VEIAKQEAQTVKPGGANNPEGRNQYSKDDEDNVSNTHNDQTKRDPEYNSNTGLLRRLAVEIAKQEAQTVKPGAPQGNKNAVKGDKTIRGNDTDCLDRNDRNQQSGLLRKDFTPTERVAIAKAIEEEIGNRQGKRTDLELTVNRREVIRHKSETKAIAAEKAGFGTVVAVVENHTPKSGMTFAVELNGVR
jgi:hypothetical protein